MAVTFLQLHNRLRAYLREEQISALAATDLLSISLSSILNGAMRQILDAYEWSFLKRDDGVLAFPEAITGANLITAAGSAEVHVEDTLGAVGYLALLQADDFVYRFQVRGTGVNPDHANDSLRVVSADAGVFAGYDRLTLDVPWIGNAGSIVGTADWLLYTHETVLPDTVARVLSVRDEDNRDFLVFQDQAIDVDPAYPSPVEATGHPEWVVVGGITQNTAGVTPPGTSGMRFAIYPPFTVSTAVLSVSRVITRRVHYRYVYRFADLATITDALTGVPDEIADLIVRRAFIDCLMGNVQNDPQRGNSLRQHLEVDLQQARARDVRDPLRRLVPSPFGSGSLRRLHPNQRWANRQVPSP